MAAQDGHPKPILGNVISFGGFPMSGNMAATLVLRNQLSCLQYLHFSMKTVIWMWRVKELWEEGWVTKNKNMRWNQLKNWGVVREFGWVTAEEWKAIKGIEDMKVNWMWRGHMTSEVWHVVLMRSGMARNLNQPKTLEFLGALYVQLKTL